VTITVRPLHLGIAIAVVVALAVAGVILASTGGDENPSQGELAVVESPAPSATARASSTPRPTPTLRAGATVLGTSTPRPSATATATSPPQATSTPAPPTATSTPSPTPTPTGVQDAANRLFVDPVGGSNSNDGKRDTPFLTLQRALSTARSLTAPEIYVGGGQLLDANGTTLEINEFATLSLHGGYDPQTWQKDPKPGLSHLVLLRRGSGPRLLGGHVRRIQLQVR
jgi:hypothetical protein